MARFHERYDLLLTPQMPITALEVGRVHPTAGATARTGSIGRLTPIRSISRSSRRPRCLAGWHGDGLPIGVQIVGVLRADRTVLRAARVIEQALPMPRPPRNS